MSLDQVLVATIAFVILIAITYTHTGWSNIKECYSMWFTKE
jgi:hypothetical protein